MCHKVTTIQSIYSLHLLKVGVVFPTSSEHLLLENVELVSVIFKLQLDDSLLRKLLLKKLSHLIGLEKATLADITNQYPEKKPYLGFLFSKHPP